MTAEELPGDEVNAGQGLGVKTELQYAFAGQGVHGYSPYVPGAHPQEEIVSDPAAEGVPLGHWKQGPPGAP